MHILVFVKQKLGSCDLKICVIKVTKVKVLKCIIAVLSLRSF